MKPPLLIYRQPFFAVPSTQVAKLGFVPNFMTFITFNRLFMSTSVAHMVRFSAIETIRVSSVAIFLSALVLSCSWLLIMSLFL